MIILLLSVYFLISIFFLYVFRAKESSLSTFFIFFIFNFIYNVSIAAEASFLGNYDIGQGYFLDYKNSITILILSIQSIVGFGLGYYVSNFRLPLRQTLSQSKNNSTPKGIITLTLTLFFILIFFNSQQMVSSFSYEGNVSNVINNPGFAFTKTLLFNCYGIIATYYILKSSRKLVYILIITAPLILISILTKDKNPMLMACLIDLIYAAQFLLKKSFKWDLLTVGSILAVIPLIIITFSVIRAIGAGSLSAKHFYQNGTFKRLDSRGPFRVLISEIKTKKKYYGETYLDSVLFILPKSIYPARPDSLATSFAKRKMKDWQPGQGMGYSLLAESYINFGVLGGLIQYTFIGLLFGIFGTLTRVLFYYSQDTILWQAIYFQFAYYNAVLMHRGHFNLISTYVRFILPLLLFHILIDRLFLKKTRLKL